MQEPRGHSVSFAGISKSYGGFCALQPTTIDIAAGEIFAILGPSGSGKSTLLGLTAGYITPTSGQIFVAGVSIEKKPPFQRNIGMVFQGYSLFPHMTVAENVAYPLRVRKIAKAEITERVNRMLDLVRLGQLASRFPSALSGGQQQRVALARAAVFDPLLLLMDEPLSALDKNLREEMQYEIKQFHQTVESTVIYVTHDQAEASSLADRIAIMKDGRIEQCDTARALYDQPANRFIALFLGQANLFEVERVYDAGGKVRVRTVSGVELRTSASRIPDGPCCVCVRAEVMTVSTAPQTTDNCVQGTITEATFVTGIIHYKIEISGGQHLMQWQAVKSKADTLPTGTPVHVCWAASDTLLVRA